MDSENLAKYLANGLLKKGKPVVQVLEDLKAIFQMGHRLTKDTTALKNRIKKNLDRAGLRMKKFDLSYIWVCQLLYHFVNQEKSLGEFLSEAIRNGRPLEKHRNIIVKNMELLQPYLSYRLSMAQRALIRQDLVDLDFKTGSKTVLEVEIEQIILDYPQLRRNAFNLASIPGISKTTAVWILSEIGSLAQFKDYRSFVAYCGCCPRIVSSADKVYSAHASRRSNVYLRKIFYSASHVVCTVLKEDSELKRYAQRILERKSRFSKKLAIYTVATKLARTTHAILKSGTPFSPDYVERHAKIGNSGGQEHLFSITDRKTLRRAKNCLKRVLEVDGVKKLGIMGEDAKKLAESLEKLLIESQIS